MNKLLIFLLGFGLGWSIVTAIILGCLIPILKEKKNKTQGKFRLCGQKPNGIIFLLDDQKTTGITLLECTKILLEGGAEQVYCFCLGINRNIETFGE